MRAILSVSDKSGLIEFAAGLTALGVELFSTGGTERSLREAGVPVASVSDLTGFPEMMDGRVKTLHPGVHGGILARRDVPEHLAQLAEHGLREIDMVVVNLYPFVATVRKPGITEEEAIENIDIGGPTMVRSAAKNFASVTVVVDPADYAAVLEEMQRAGATTLETRRGLAVKAYQHTSTYDSYVAAYLRGDDAFPEHVTLPLTKQRALRYGENPHQQAALYSLGLEEGRGPNLVGAQLVLGAELSFNNYLDLNAAWTIVRDFAAPTVTIIKHTNPCGLASRDDLMEAYKAARAGDPVSAFGGIVGINRIVDARLAHAIARHHYDCIIAPAFGPGALREFESKKNLRVVAVGEATGTPAPLPAYLQDIRRIDGGYLVQTRDFVLDDIPLKTVTRREPTAEELRDLRFAWRVARYVRSNAIVLAKDRSLVGVGAGQMSRVDSVEIACRKAGERTPGSVLASDAYFPFPDGLEYAARAGVTAMIEPGGSVNDADVIRAADELNVAMVFTGRRHFLH